MKKVELLTLFILFMSSVVIGQTNVFPTSGNVVINSGNLIQSGDYYMQTQGAIKLRNYLLFDSDGDFTGGNYYTIQDDPTNNYLRLGYNFYSNLVIDSTGNVGIGTTTPHQKLEVSGNIRLNTGTAKIEWGNNTLQLGNYDDAIPVVQIMGSKSYSPRLDIMNAGNTNQMIILSASGNSFLNGGNVGIGTTSPQYKLDVIGTIRAREIKVDLNGADFVFENNYKLRSLTSLEHYVNENKHLPGIESAYKMEADGTDLGALNTKLLQKIEELTLYIIKQDKKITELEKQGDELQLLKRRIEALESASKREN